MFREAVYVSVWNVDEEISTSCLYNSETMVCTKIQSSDDQPDGVLTDEYVVFEGGHYRAEDGVIFDY
jgi:hypothetical protein